MSSLFDYILNNNFVIYSVFVLPLLSLSSSLKIYIVVFFGNFGTISLRASLMSPKLNDLKYLSFLSFYLLSNLYTSLKYVVPFFVNFPYMSIYPYLLNFDCFFIYVFFGTGAFFYFLKPYTPVYYVS